MTKAVTLKSPTLIAGKPTWTITNGTLRIKGIASSFIADETDFKELKRGRKNYGDLRYARICNACAAWKKATLAPLPEDRPQSDVWGYKDFVAAGKVSSPAPLPAKRLEIGQ